jgi:hypothetical protein
MPRYHDDDDPDEPLYTEAELEDALAQMRDAAFERGRQKGRAEETKHIMDFLWVAASTGASPEAMTRMVASLPPLGLAAARN